MSRSKYPALTKAAALEALLVNKQTYGNVAATHAVNYHTLVAWARKLRSKAQLNAVKQAANVAEKV